MRELLGETEEKSVTLRTRSMIDRHVKMCQEMVSDVVCIFVWGNYYLWKDVPPGSNTQSEKPKENYVSDKTCNNLWPFLANFGEYLALLAVFVKRCFRLTTFPTQGESASRATSHFVQAVRIQKNRKGINNWLPALENLIFAQCWYCFPAV